ncbi:MAG: hypothetical protein M1819_003863 [Sarea resinae]|nr:MAG: hypothetical protein M1819_003863 [Sarea resinae]
MGVKEKGRWSEFTQNETNAVKPEENLKAVIHALFQLQLSIHGYQHPQTAQTLKDQLTDFTATLSHTLHKTQTQSPPLPSIPPEIIAYVDSGRNPDIYTREFVELAQEGNRALKARMEAFAAFRDVLAREMGSALPELRAEVGKVVEDTGGVWDEKGEREVLGG